MMRNKKGLVAGILLLCIFMFLFIRSREGKNHSAANNKNFISPILGDVLLTVTTTGVVEPQNRLELKPSISGRIEEILVNEGSRVKKGDILAWMSSSERAALIDAARSRGEEALKYWEEAYKKTPIISPIDGEVIVRPVEPGQTVSSSDAVLVLSDRLVVNAQFDETDIGKVKVGQEAFITLDAYPDIKLEGEVNHVAYESEVVNNVTIYNVDILPGEIPEILRSGMSVTVDVIEKKAANVLTSPSKAVRYEGNRQFVMVRDRWGKTSERDIEVGLDDGQAAEVVSGLSIEDNVISQDILYLPKSKSLGTSPFMPQRRR